MHPYTRRQCARPTAAGDEYEQPTCDLFAETTPNALGRLILTVATVNVAFGFSVVV